MSSWQKVPNGKFILEPSGPVEFRMIKKEISSADRRSIEHSVLAFHPLLKQIFEVNLSQYITLRCRLDKIWYFSRFSPVRFCSGLECYQIIMAERWRKVFPFLMWNINWMPKYDYQKTLLIPGDNAGITGFHLRTAENQDELREGNCFIRFCLYSTGSESLFYQGFIQSAFEKPG